MVAEPGPAEISNLEPASHTLQAPEREEAAPSGQPPPAYSIMADDLPANGNREGPSHAAVSSSERAPLLGAQAASSRRRAKKIENKAKPQTLLIRSLYFLLTLLLFISVSGVLFVGISTLHPWASRILPPHHGSTFVPLWYCILSTLTLLLAIAYFSFPHSTPHFFTYLSLSASVIVVIDIAAVGANPDLRTKESWLTVTAALLLLLASLLAAASLPAVERFLPAVEAAAEAKREAEAAERAQAEEEERHRRAEAAGSQYVALPISIQPPERPPSAARGNDPEASSQSSPRSPTFRRKLRRGCAACLEFTGVTLPLLILHIAVLVALILMTADLVLRAYDFSAPPPSPARLWEVDPGDGSRGYRFLLACQPFGGKHHQRDPDLFEPVADDNATLPRRTLLFFSPSGVAGLSSAAWALNLSAYLAPSSLRYSGQSPLDTAVRTHAHQRICYFDRPGYSGFSDNAPTARLRHTVLALEQALEKSGETDRLTGRGGGRDRGGFVLAAQGFGGMVARVFAARNPEVVTGIVFIDSQTELTYFNPAEGSWEKTLRHLFRDYGSALLSPLGVRRYLALIFGTSPSLSRHRQRPGAWRPPNQRGRLARLLSPAREGLNPSVVRATLQEAHLAHSHLSSSYRDLERSRQYWPEGIKTIVISSQDRLQDGTRWTKGQEWLAKALAKGKDSVRWDKVPGEGDPCNDQGPGLAACKAAVRDLLVR